MFEHQAQGFLIPKQQRLMALYQSVNQPLMAPQMDVEVEPADCSFFVLEDDQQAVMIGLGVFFPLSQYRILYEMKKFPVEELAERVALAEAFAGEMGFMMKDIHLSSSSPQEQEHWRSRIVFFYRDVQDYLSAVSNLNREFPKEKRSQEGQVINSQFFEVYAKMMSML
jgi:hypothetical protein